MHTTFFVLSFLLFFCTIDGNPQHSSSTNADVEEATQFMKKVWSFSSNESKVFTKLQCQIAKQCCPPKTYSKVFEILAEDKITNDTATQIGTICLKSSARNIIAKKCPAVLKISSLPARPAKVEPNMNNPQVVEAALKVMGHGVIYTDLPTDAYRTCSPNEIHAFNCMLSEKLIQSCVRKIIQKKADPRNKNANPDYGQNLKAAMKDMYEFLKLSS